MSGINAIDDSLVPPTLRSARANMAAAASGGSNVAYSETPPATTDAPASSATGQDPAEAERLRKLEAQVATLSGMLKARDRELNGLKRSAAPAEPDPIVVDEYRLDLPSVNVTDEERSKYANATNYITTIVVDTINKAMAPMLSRLTTLERGVKNVEATTERKLSVTAKSSFDAALAAAVPDLSSLVGHASFQTFLDEEVPMLGGATVQQVLEHANTKQDVQRIRSIMDSFRAKYAKGNDRSPFRQPTVGSGSNPPSTNEDLGKPEILNWSTRVKAWDAHRAGVMTAEDFAKVKAKFEAAQRENRVNYNA